MADFDGIFPGIQDYAQQQVGGMEFDANQVANASAEAELFMMDPKVGEQVTQKIDGVDPLKDAGVLFRTNWGKTRQVRLPKRTGDITVVVTFGPRPDKDKPPEEMRRELANQATNAALSCGATAFALLGYAVGAFVTGPVGWVALAFALVDGVAFSTGAISCMVSGIRVLNIERGNREGNERMDQNRALNAVMPYMDLGGDLAAGRNVVGVAREARDAIKEVKLTRSLANELLGAVGAGLGMAGSLQGGELQQRLAALRLGAQRDKAGIAVNDALANGGLRTPDYSVALSSG